jgi:hypothetical protein
MLNGAATSALIGTLHYKFVTIVGLFPLQVAEYVE